MCELDVREYWSDACAFLQLHPYHLNPLTAGFYLIKLLPFLSSASVVTQVNKSHRRFGLKKSHYKHFNILLTLPDTVHSTAAMATVPERDTTFTVLTAFLQSISNTFAAESSSSAENTVRTTTQDRRNADLKKINEKEVVL